MINLIIIIVPARVLTVVDRTHKSKTKKKLENQDGTKTLTNLYRIVVYTLKRSNELRK